MFTSTNRETIARIEERLERIENGKDVPFDLPQSIPPQPPLVDVAILQLIITWAIFRTGMPVRTQVTAGSHTEARLQELILQPYGLVAFLACRNIFALDGRDITAESEKARAKFFHEDAAPFTMSSRGNQMSLIVAHSSILPRSFLPYIDLCEPTKRTERKAPFMEGITRCFRTLYEATRTAPLYAEKAVVEIVYELFTNAEQWGCTTFTSRPVKIPIRGILATVHPIKKSPSSPSSEPVDVYLSSFSNDKDVTHVLDISVFDSGIGLAQRHLNRAISKDTPLSEEIREIGECLQKHGTSSEHSTRGLGLHYVMDSLSKMRGFLRLRSGRLHLFRNFITDEYALARMRESRITRTRFSQYLRDWSTGVHAVNATSAGGETAPSAMHASATVKGAAISFLIPLKSAQLPLNYV